MKNFYCLKGFFNMSRSAEDIYREIEQNKERIRVLQSELEDKKNEEARKKLLKVLEKWSFTHSKPNFLGLFRKCAYDGSQELERKLGVWNAEHHSGRNLISKIEVHFANGEAETFENISAKAFESLEQSEKEICYSLLSQECRSCKQSDRKIYMSRLRNSPVCRSCHFIYCSSISDNDLQQVVLYGSDYVCLSEFTGKSFNFCDTLMKINKSLH